MPEVIAGVMVRRKGDPDPRYTFYPGTSNVQLEAGTIYERHYASPKGEFTTLGSAPVEGVTLTGGSMTLVGDDLVLSPPTASGGNPTPAVVLVLMRGATNVTSQVVNNRIANAPVGAYEATWTAGTATTTATLEVLADPQIVTATGVTLPTPGMFDTMTVGNLPGYATLINPASYASTDPQGGVGTITVLVNDAPATANTALQTDDTVKVRTEGTDGEIPLIHDLGTVQWTWTTAVNAATQTLTFSDNPAAPDALSVTVAATIGSTDYQWSSTLGNIRAKPVFAQGYPKDIKPEGRELVAGDTISGDVGIVLTDGGLNIVAELTRDGDPDPDHAVSSWQITSEDYGQRLGFKFTLNDGRQPTSGSTPGVSIIAPVEVPVEAGVRRVATGAGVADATGNIVIPAPDPSLVQDGDLVLVSFGAVGNQPDPTLAGYTKLATIGSTTNVAMANPLAYWKKVSGPLEAITVPVAEATAAHMTVFRGADIARVIAIGRRGATSDGAVIAPGGAVTGGSLSFTVAATRSGNTSAVLTNPANASLESITEVLDVRTLAGNDVSLTTYVGKIPDATTLVTETTTTLPGLARWAAVQIEITGAA